MTGVCWDVTREQGKVSGVGGEGELRPHRGGGGIALDYRTEKKKERIRLTKEHSCGVKAQSCGVRAPACLAECPSCMVCFGWILIPWKYMPAVLHHTALFPSWLACAGVVC